MAAATMYVTPAGAGAKNGTNWANAFGLAEWETDAEGAAEAGDIYYVYTGTYTLTQNFDATGRDATATAVIQVIGVSDEALTLATGDDRPLIDVGTYQFRFGQFWNIENLRATGTGNFSHTFHVQAGGIFRNCKGNASGNNGIVFYFAGIESKAISCEASGAIGFGFRTSTDTVLIGCYMHDVEKGIVCEGARLKVLYCLFDTLNNQGIDCQSWDNLLVFGNTFYNCTFAILSTTSDSCLIMNNIIDSCILGIVWTTEQQSNLFDYNNYYNNGSDTANITKGANAMAIAPAFLDAPNGDFRIGPALRGQAYPGTFPGELCTGYPDVGAVQRYAMSVFLPIGVAAGQVFGW